MLTKSAAWKALEDHQRKMRDVHLRDLFADDPGRGQRMTAEAAGVYLDYSKNRIGDETLMLLLDLAEQSGLRAHIDAMFRGEKINSRKIEPPCMSRFVRRRASINYSGRPERRAGGSCRAR